MTKLLAVSFSEDPVQEERWAEDSEHAVHCTEESSFSDLLAAWKELPDQQDEDEDSDEVFGFWLITPENRVLAAVVWDGQTAGSDSEARALSRAERALIQKLAVKTVLDPVRFVLEE